MGTQTILLVEDNADDAELTEHAFRQNRITTDIVHARDGEEALDYLFGTGGFTGRDRHSMPALILLDLKLPRIDGLEVLRRLRAQSETRRIPVVILTTSDEESDIARGYDLGANSYIRKPVDFGEFNRVVDQLGLYWLAINTPSPV